jgi:hypothetical protein
MKKKKARKLTYIFTLQRYLSMMLWPYIEALQGKKGKKLPF